MQDYQLIVFLGNTTLFYAVVRYLIQRNISEYLVVYKNRTYSKAFVRNILCSSLMDTMFVCFNVSYILS